MGESPGTPMISLVIPTRERAEFLRAAILSAIRAADRAGCQVEIVISDNASSDRTPEVVADFTDPRIVSLRTDHRLSMRENFEFALSHAKGRHIVFIGDDDAVLPNGLRVLSSLLSAHDPDIVKWRVLNFVWPDPATGLPGTLRVRPSHLDGRLELIDPRATLVEFSRAACRSYQQGGMIYHGCISRRLIDEIRARTGGPYFRGSAPDVFTSMQALMVATRPMLRLNLPVTLGGASPKSNGAAGLQTARAGKAIAGTEFARFVTESENDPYQCRLPARCQSVEMMTLDCLLTAARLHKVDLKVELSAWQDRIAAEIVSFAEPARSDCQQLAREVFGMEITLPPLGETSIKEPDARLPSETRDAPPARLKKDWSKLDFAGGAAMADAASAADLLDRLTDLENFVRPTSGLLQALVRILRLRARALPAVSGSGAPD